MAIRNGEALVLSDTLSFVAEGGREGLHWRPALYVRFVSC